MAVAAEAQFPPIGCMGAVKQLTPDGNSGQIGFNRQYFLRSFPLGNGNMCCPSRPSKLQDRGAGRRVARAVLPALVFVLAAVDSSPAFAQGGLRSGASADARPNADGHQFRDCVGHPGS